MNNSNQKKKPNKEIGHKRKLNVEDLKQQIKNVGKIILLLRHILKVGVVSFRNI